MAVKFEKIEPAQVSPNTLIGLEEIWKEVDGLPRFTRSSGLADAVKRSAAMVFAAPFSSVLTLVSAALAMFLVCAFLYLRTNLENALGSRDAPINVSVFLKDDVPLEQALKMKTLIENTVQVEAAVYKSKEEALQSFGSALEGDASLIEGLEELNPLPASIEVSLANAPGVAELAASLKRKLEGSSGVERVLYGESFAQSSEALHEALRLSGVLSMLVVVLVSAFIVTTSIRLSLHTHRDEIDIMRLVGAKHSTIELPYIIEGAFHGLFGAIIAIAVLYIVHQLVVKIHAESDLLNLLIPTVSLPSAALLGLVVLAGGVVGVLASYLAVRRYLHESE